MVARVTTLQRSDPDEAKAYIEQYVVPSLRRERGFVGALFLAERRNQTSISITIWESAEAEAGSQEGSVERRAHSARMTGAVFETTDSYEVLGQVLPQAATA